MEISDQIIKVLDALSEKLGVAIDWSSKNIAPYLQQLCSKYVNYKIWISIIWIVAGLVIISLAIILHKKLNHNKTFGIVKYETISDDWFGRIVSYVGIGVTYLIGALTIIKQLLVIVTCLTFPEKVIIDVLLPLIK